MITQNGCLETEKDQNKEVVKRLALHKVGKTSSPDKVNYKLPGESRVDGFIVGECNGWLGQGEATGLCLCCMYSIMTMEKADKQDCLTFNPE